MILAIHILLGGFLITIIKPLWLALIIIFLSHFLIDIIPHWDYDHRNIRKGNWGNSTEDFLRVSLDLLIGLTLIVVLSKNIVLASLGAFISALPDFLSLINAITPKSKVLEKIKVFHESLHFLEKKISKRWGFFIEVIIFLFFILLYLL